MNLTKQQVQEELAAPAVRDAQRKERAVEVAKIVAHANSKDHMKAEDDAVARPLFLLLKEHRIIPSDVDGFLEWQGAWEFGLAAYFYGKDYDCLNVNADGSVDLM
jgi:hypothetical protein